MYSENFMEFAAWNSTQKIPLKPLTGTQAAFAEFLITHHKEINKIGDLESVFAAVRTWLKTYPEMWIEHEYIPPALSHAIPTPEHNEEIIIEQPGFNWTLAMKDIEKKYKNKVPLEDQLPDLLPFEKDLYDNKMNSEKKVPDLIEYGKGKKLVKCKCIGVTNSVIGYRIDIGTKVYYHAVQDVYLIPNGAGSYISYYPKTITVFINYNGVMPNGKPVVLPNSAVIKMIDEEPEQNFHAEQTK